MSIQNQYTFSNLHNAYSSTVVLNFSRRLPACDAIASSITKKSHRSRTIVATVICCRYFGGWRVLLLLYTETTEQTKFFAVATTTFENFMLETIEFLN